jgi:8-oxo-dGTP pyrophosphatase MutT (NUDIX family)
VNTAAEDPDDVPIRPAATVIVARDQAVAGGDGRLEVLLVCRNKGLAFHGGSWVFPGGRIDPHEIESAGGDVEAAALTAAVREVHEETGLVLTPDILVPFSHWTTPRGRNRRFSTHFFVAPAPTDSVLIDGGEIHDFDWFTPAEATARSEAGDIQLAGPTYVSLLRLGRSGSLAAAIEAAHAGPYQVFAPRLIAGADGTHTSVYAEDAAYHSGDLDAPGRRHRMIMHADRYTYVSEEG